MSIIEEAKKLNISNSIVSYDYFKDFRYELRKPREAEILLKNISGKLQVSRDCLKKYIDVSLKMKSPNKISGIISFNNQNSNTTLVA